MLVESHKSAVKRLYGRFTRVLAMSRVSGLSKILTAWGDQFTVQMNTASFPHWGVLRRNKCSSVYSNGARRSIPCYGTFCLLFGSFASFHSYLIKARRPTYRKLKAHDYH
ncbi:hypothetical protein CEXT_788311 [Caerostris extrusa]|uniref:Uncharacterized protein n=1 Tax=Caerostris extrusa TaxID=172846 RepID=A0AAV4WNC1_CAEEX|nr:hypothetical protein CEXT_788311 [Caerostris extrusa]